jgi:hypothetical protein
MFFHNFFMDREKLMKTTAAILRSLVDLSPLGVDRAEPRVDGLKGPAKPQNRVTSVKLKSRTFMAGTTMSKVSSPEARTAGDIASTFDSIAIKP